MILDVNRVTTTNTQFISHKGASINSFFPINQLISINPNFDDNVSYDVIAPDIKQNVLASMASSLHGTIVPFDEGKSTT